MILVIQIYISNNLLILNSICHLSKDKRHKQISKALIYTVIGRVDIAIDLHRSSPTLWRNVRKVSSYQVSHGHYRVYVPCRCQISPEQFIGYVVFKYCYIVYKINNRVSAEIRRRELGC